MPHLMECTLTANQPLNRPTIMPLIDEPTRMPPINGRASGVNQAVAPSMAPRTSPKINPTRILFMALLRESEVSTHHSASLAIPLKVSQKKEHELHRRIRSEEPKQDRVAAPKSTQAVPDGLPPGLHPQPRMEALEASQKVIHRRIALRRIRLHRLERDRPQGGGLTVGKHEVQEDAKGVNVGTVIQFLLRRAKRRGARHRVHAPVHRVNLSKLADHHVLGLEIPLNHTAHMA